MPAQQAAEAVCVMAMDLGKKMRQQACMCIVWLGQTGLPCARDSVPGVVATSFLVFTMQGASVARTRSDGPGASVCFSVSGTDVAAVAARHRPTSAFAAADMVRC
jgi:hypothetical protein